MPARISFYRPNGQSRRANRGAHDHDVFEGLPVRRWTRSSTTIITPSPASSNGPQIAMPKDHTLLTQHAQGLLAAARSSSSSKPSVADRKPKAARESGGDVLFSLKKWNVIPRGQEPPELEYLAKGSYSKRGADGEERSVIGGRKLPPIPQKKKKRIGRPPREKNVALEDKDGIKDVDLMDLDGATDAASDMMDPATREDEVPSNEVDKMMEEQERNVEEATLQQEKELQERGEEHLPHALPDVDASGNPNEKVTDGIIKKDIEDEAPVPHSPSEKNGSPAL